MFKGFAFFFLFGFVLSIFAVALIVSGLNQTTKTDNQTKFYLLSPQKQADLELACPISPYTASEHAKCVQTFFKTGES